MRNIESSAIANEPDAHAPEFLRTPSVLKRTGLARSTIYRLMSENKFPAPVRLADRAAGGVAPISIAGAPPAP